MGAKFNETTKKKDKSSYVQGRYKEICYKELEALIQTIKIYNQDIGIEFFQLLIYIYIYIYIEENT